MICSIHQVSCAAFSGEPGTASFEAAQAAAEKIEKYAKKLGFNVMYENVDKAEDSDEISERFDIDFS
jgi:hypothetical protein